MVVLFASPKPLYVINGEALAEEHLYDTWPKIFHTPCGKSIVDKVYNVFDVMALPFVINVPITWYPNILISFGVTNGYGNVKFSLNIIESDKLKNELERKLVLYIYH